MWLCVCLRQVSGDWPEAAGHESSHASGFVDEMNMPQFWGAVREARPGADTGKAWRDIKDMVRKHGHV